MSDPGPQEKCTGCPLLGMAAETERLTRFGIIPVDSDAATQYRIAAVIIGQRRAEHGCSGPTRWGGTCRFYYEKYNVELTTDPNIPLLKRRIEDGQDHLYK